MVVDPGMTDLERGQLLTDEMYHDALEQHGDEFDARMGAEAIRELLRTTDLEEEIRQGPRRSSRRPARRPARRSSPSA